MRRPPDDPVPNTPLTLSTLMSEWVYKLICLIERLIRWFVRNVIRPCRYLIWCLRM